MKRAARARLDATTLSSPGNVIERTHATLTVTKVIDSYRNLRMSRERLSSFPSVPLSQNNQTRNLWVDSEKVARFYFGQVCVYTFRNLVKKC